MSRVAPSPFNFGLLTCAKNSWAGRPSTCNSMFYWLVRVTWRRALSVNTVMADDTNSVWPWPPAACTHHAMQPAGQAVHARRCLLFTDGNGEVMNEIASFIHACVVVRLCHQSGISRRSFTVRNVRGTSSHSNYQTDLQHLRSLVGKTSSNVINNSFAIFNSRINHG